MAIMDGIEATWQIKKNFPELPDIAVMAYALDIDKERIDESGGDDYIEEPIQNNILQKILLKYLKGESGIISCLCLSRML